jgi:hypothetical protein
MNLPWGFPLSDRSRRMGVLLTGPVFYYDLSEMGVSKLSFLTFSL